MSPILVIVFRPCLFTCFWLRIVFPPNILCYMFCFSDQTLSISTPSRIKKENKVVRLFSEHFLKKFLLWALLTAFISTKRYTQRQQTSEVETLYICTTWYCSITDYRMSCRAGPMDGQCGPIRPPHVHVGARGRRGAARRPSPLAGGCRPENAWWAGRTYMCFRCRRSMGFKAGLNESTGITWAFHRHTFFFFLYI